ncbi:MAG: hypothetical protein JW876_07205 [Candidatus Krumholzibacteriota bacterium]|nr:hypothetical protein [Candidatus Krumholzibacteriota bacterium]
MNARSIATTILLAGLLLPAAGRGGAAPMAADNRMTERWEIRVQPGALREFVYTNKEATHFSGEATNIHTRSYHGLFSSMHEYLDRWEIAAGGRPLDPRTAEARAYPHVLVREYPGGVKEEILLPDEENGLLVRVTNLAAGDASFTPVADMRFIWETPRPEYRIFWDARGNVLFVSRADEPAPAGRPAWITVTAGCPLRYEPVERFETARYAKDAARKAMAETHPFTPGRLLFEADGGPVTFAVGLGDTEDEAAEQAARILGRFDELAEARLRRIEEIVERTGFRADDERLAKAFRWAVASMDNLVMNQRGRGIYAGFHWFPTYWGRDSFICLPGALLATRRHDVAREVLLSFMTYQQRDPGSMRLGRFPNIVDPEHLQYAGVDGTWWLVRAAWKYWLATGDAAFLAEAWPAVELAVAGALETAVDDEGFLVHGDGETWMDAGGEQNPYSPRGDRAVEVQVLFRHGLLVGAAWARTLAGRVESGEAARPAGGAPPEAAGLRRLAAAWTRRAADLQTDFRRRFIGGPGGSLVDHLNADGSADGQLRPNAILACWVALDWREIPASGPGAVEAEPLLTVGEIETVMRGCGPVILPHGIASLDPADPDFKPRHLDLDRYYYDAAYHNGDVWEWLMGPAVTCLRAAGRAHEARALVQPLVDEILDEACVGSLREIRDGRYEAGKEEFGGATSQAWSLAEFIRVCLEETDAARR